ncbi:MAG: hypothetical protein PHU34_06545 [Candidatus Methanoperedens sp.]|nr:hypothetical protein [Candidatus Methanoperedens sp.]
MTNIKLILMVITLTLIFLGCIQPQPPISTPTPTATPTVTATEKPTVVPTTPITTPSPTPESIPRVYKSFVDQYYGFKRVVESNYTQFAYENLTLNIHVGDTVLWINDADPDEILTIVSEQGLWSNTSAKLRWNYQKINYTFTKPGTYGVYIHEYPRLTHQKIVVSK